MPYSVSPCMFLYWALSEPPSEAEAVIAMTLDGNIPSESEPLMEWVKSDRMGFPYWREHSTRHLSPGYPLVDLICEKDTSGSSTVFHAEICDEESVELQDLPERRMSPELLQDVAIDRCRRLHLQYARQPSEMEAIFLFLWFSAFYLFVKG